MFEAGKRYWARNGNYSVKVLCVKRTGFKATFSVRESDAKRYFGTKPRFTKRICEADVQSRDGRWREYVPFVSSSFPGCRWCITDEEVMPHGRKCL